MVINIPLLGNRKIIAADIRFCKPDICNDHVWEANLGTGFPPAVSFSTTYGLRAIKMQLFPGFSRGNITRIDPSSFHKQPSVGFFSTNFIELLFSPFKDIDVVLKVWVPGSQVIVGQVSLINKASITQTTNMDWMVQLEPVLPGNNMVLGQMGINKVLKGRSDTLFPVFYLTGGPEESTSPYPGLTTRIVLPPDALRQVTWVLSTQDSHEASLQTARQYSSRHLDNEQIKSEMEDKKHIVRFIKIEPDKNSVLENAQRQARQLVMPEVNLFNYPSFVLERSPSSGACPDLGQLEMNPEWSGQTLTDIQFLAQTLLPGYPHLIKGFLQNEIDAQDTDGSINYEVGANHRDTGLLAPPLLCSLVETLLPCMKDQSWLKQIYPSLAAFVANWIVPVGSSFEPRGWTHPLQTGLIDYHAESAESIKDFWLREKSAESPYLLSILLREIKSLASLEERLHHPLHESWIKPALEYLTEKLGGLWDPDQQAYVRHESAESTPQPGSILVSFSGAGVYPSTSKFTSAQRVFIRIDNDEPLPHNFSAELTGRVGGKANKVKLSVKDFRQLADSTFYISPVQYTSVTHLKIQNIGSQKSGTLGIADLNNQDITKFLPLWAGLPSQSQVDAMLADNKFSEFLNEQGLWFESCKTGNPNLRAPGFLAAWIIEGLLQYNKHLLALSVFEKHFLSPYALQQQSRHPGEFRSLIPVNLFLKILGIREIHSDSVLLESKLLDFEPVTVQYGQIEISISKQDVSVKLAGGHPVSISTSGIHKVVLESERR